MITFSVIIAFLHTLTHKFTYALYIYIYIYIYIYRMKRFSFISFASILFYTMTHYKHLFCNGFNRFVICLDNYGRMIRNVLTGNLLFLC